MIIKQSLTGVIALL